MRFRLTFHVSRVRTVGESELSPTDDPVWIIDSAPAYMVQQILDVR